MTHCGSGRAQASGRVYDALPPIYRRRKRDGGKGPAVLNPGAQCSVFPVSPYTAPGFPSFQPSVRAEVRLVNTLLHSGLCL